MEKYVFLVVYTYEDGTDDTCAFSTSELAEKYKLLHEEYLLSTKFYYGTPDSLTEKEDILAWLAENASESVSVKTLSVNES